MHAVIWTLGNNRYATPTRDVVEVTPVVDVRPLPGSPAWLCGLMNYRGQLVPLVDVASLIGVPPIRQKLYSRILVVRANEAQGTAVMGLLVESVLAGDELDLTVSQSSDPARRRSQGFLGPVSLFDFGTVQLTDATQIVMPRLTDGSLAETP